MKGLDFSKVIETKIVDNSMFLMSRSQVTFTTAYNAICMHSVFAVILVVRIYIQAPQIHLYCFLILNCRTLLLLTSLLFIMHA